MEWQGHCGREWRDLVASSLLPQSSAPVDPRTEWLVLHTLYLFFFLITSGLEMQFWFGKCPSPDPLTFDFWRAALLCRYPGFPGGSALYIKKNFLCLLLIKISPPVAGLCSLRAAKGFGDVSTWHLWFPWVVWHGSPKEYWKKQFPILHSILLQSSPVWTSDRVNGGGGATVALSQLKGHRRAITALHTPFKVFCFSSEQQT